MPGYESGVDAPLRATADALERRFPHLRGQLLAFEGRVVLPLRSGEHILGVLYAAYAEPQTFDDERRAYCLAVSDRIAQALERARLFDAARRSDEQTRALQAVTAEQRGSSVQINLRVAAKELGKVIGREGRIARSMRTIVMVAGSRNNVRANLDIDGNA